MTNVYTVCLLIVLGQIAVTFVHADFPSECCICDDTSSDPTQRCSYTGICQNSFHFCPYCLTKKQFVNNAWATTRSCGDHDTCETNWFQSIAQPGCSNGAPADGTTCYTCCKTPSPHQPHYCTVNPDYSYVTFYRTIPTTTPTTTITTTTSPPPPGSSECCICDDTSSDPTQRCSYTGICQNSVKFCPYCLTKKQFVNNAWATTRSCGDHDTCETKWFQSKSEPGCSSRAPTDGTTCYSCCKASSHQPHECTANPDYSYVTFYRTVPTTTPATTITTTTSPPAGSSECCICDDNSSDPTQRCSYTGICQNSVKFCPYCLTKNQFANNAWATTRSCGDHDTCETKWFQSKSEPGCSSRAPTDGTTCYSCCKASSHQPHECTANPDYSYVTFYRTAPITTPITTTAAATGPVCDTCSLSSGLSCTSTTRTTCASGENYCMNTIITDDSGTNSIRKSCASETECYYDSYIGMQTSAACTASATSGTFTTKGACHYCCKSDNQTTCNSQAVPAVLANYNKPVTTECETGRDGTYTVQKCNSVAPLCMNTVIVSSGYTTVKKACDGEVVCDTDWWRNTRNKPECMSKNFTALPQATIDAGVVCHYCCKSENGQPCNTEDVPTEVFDYVDGGWTDWTEWQGCTADCTGIRVRLRTCSNPYPGKLGQRCQGTTVEDEVCTATNCPGSGAVIIG